ncbi:MAG: class I SAM-dependent methyltransferase [Deltaproteobacteria bacterium]|nr:class I SAM-dependent methyltransferase [Deltaproteobacteria bacterium]MBW2737777.1 class I SAM-dependent methyltransferase [Deltaproteobacteria bacterium]
MNINYSDLNLNQTVKNEISRLLRSIDNNKDDLENIWQLMDIVWNEYRCNNKKLNWSNIDKFYSHPIWLLNGLFIEQHALSMQHRNAISDWIAGQPSISKILDYGGGFGTLARLIADENPSLLVDIYEPHPSDYSKQKISDYPQIQFISNIKEKYDVLVSTDVLEHVPDPLKTFEKMILSVKDNGYLIIANNFFPVIKCHLPQTFHLRYTFNVFAKLMGLVIVGPLEESHATIFRKESNKPVNWLVVRLLEKASKGLFPLIEFSKSVLRPIYRLVKHENTPR